MQKVVVFIREREVSPWLCFGFRFYLRVRVLSY